MRLAFAFAFAAAASVPGMSALAAVDAPNAVRISPRLDTSGQPSRAFLERLKAEGYEVVVYLAPPTVPDAVADEPLIVGRQRLVYVNIPISFGAPAAADFENFTRVMGAFQDRKVYVHCQANFRASSMVFLDRVIRMKEKPDVAFESVLRAWKPDATWHKFIVDTLRANGIAYEPL
jgi:protein tyrosine phosphatase (PTP) superfamily phosphohydrolase (DUF442 family)